MIGLVIPEPVEMSVFILTTSIKQKCRDTSRI